MTEVLNFTSSPSTENPAIQSQSHSNSPSSDRGSSSPSPSSPVIREERHGGIDCDSRVTEIQEEEFKKRDNEREEFSLLALLFAVIRKSFIVCRANGEKLCVMEIGLPTDVRHVAHVTFDRFNGFLGLPDEFEPEVPRRAPSASTSVFGVSTESMQLSYDFRGNCVPTILVLMQRRLYAQGGLQAEGIFRINAENDQEEFVRNELNRGVIPDDIDVHCLAGLIKAWFRELPSGVLDPLSPERMMQCTSEEDCSELVRILPPTEAALLDWAINLMADIVQEEQSNKMNAHNIAMVFAPNMTQMAEPLTALMYAVQVMNFLKTLIMKTLRERQDSRLNLGPTPCREPSDESGRQSPSQLCLENYLFDNNEGTEIYSSAENDEPVFGSSHDSSTPYADESDDSSFQWESSKSKEVIYARNEFSGQSSTSTVNRKETLNSSHGELLPLVTDSAEKSKTASNLKLISSRIERIEAWR